jgi:hypothetical protein
MSVKWVSFVVFVGLLLLTSSGVITHAQGPESYTMGIEVNADGSWGVVELLGQKVNLTPESFNGLASLLGLQVALPTQALPPESVALLTQAGVKQLTLAMDGQTTRVWVNEQFLPEVEINPMILKGLIGDVSGLLTQALTFVRGTVYVRLPSGEGIHPDLTQTIARATAREAAVVNSAKLEATLSPEGRWLSAGGFTREDATTAGLPLPLDLAPTYAALLAKYDKIEVDITPGEFLVKADNEPAVRLIWDQDSRLALANTVENFLGIALDPQAFATAESWLEDSNVSLVLNIADEPQDGAPVVEINSPITVALNGTAAPTVEGVPIYGLAPQVMGVVMQTAQFAGIDQMQACWSGGHLYWLVNGMPMPYVTIGDGWLSTAIRLTGFQPLPAADKIEQTLSNVTLPANLSLGTASAASSSACGAYQSATAKALMAINVDATWARQSDELTLGQVNLPSLVPLDLSAKIHVPGASAFVPANLKQVAVTVGPAGFSANINDVDVAIHWDSTLLSNLAKVVDRVGYGDVVRQAAQVLGVTEITFNVESTEKVASGPEARLEPTTQAVASLMPMSPAAATTESEVATARPPATETQEPTGRSTQGIEVPQEPLVQPTGTREALEPTAGPTADICVVKAGDTLWDCWLQFGGTQGTGMPWAEWSTATAKAYDLKVIRDRIVVVRPGDKITMLPTQ